MLQIRLCWFYGYNMNARKRILCFFLLICMNMFTSPSMNASDNITVTVNNQADFDQLTEKLKAAIYSDHDDVYVMISPGRYVAHEHQIKLIRVIAPTKRIHIVGHDAVVIPKGREYRDGEVYEDKFSINNCWMNQDKDVDTWSHVRQADGLVEVVDPETKECVLKGSDTFPFSVDYENAYILITHWFQSSVYKVTEIDGRYIYFTAHDLDESYSKNGYNINDDYNYGKMNPRYKLCNVDTGDDYLRIIDGRVFLPYGMTSVREGQTHRYITIKDCRFRSLEISGIKFLGNSQKDANPAIYLKDIESESVLIHECEFRGFRSSVITSKSTNDVVIENNVFSDCYFSGIQSDNASVSTVVKGNSFSSMGKRMTNSFCVICHGANYRILKNIFVDFGYSGIGVGVWYKGSKKNDCSGVVEHNELKYSDDYVADIANHAIMDNGAIYLWTKNDGSIIRYNYINNFSGVKHNRGIFCDDGAYNYKLIGNVITEIANSYCIDARKEAKVEESITQGTGIERANVNIVMKENIVDGKIRFVGSDEEDNGCVMETNYFLLDEGEELPKNVIDNVSLVGENVVLNHTGEKNGRIGISSRSLRQLRQSTVWQEVKDYLVRKNNFFL